MKFTIRGQEFTITEEVIIKAMNGIQPEGKGKYLVQVNGIEYPVKQVLGKVTKLPPVGYTTGDAYRILSRVGLSVREDKLSTFTISNINEFFDKSKNNENGINIISEALVVEYETYENRNNPHITIHKKGCSQLRKRGGIHNYGQGKYCKFISLEEARAYAKTTGFPIKECSFCNPQNL